MYAILALIMAGIPVMEYAKRRGKARGSIIYTYPWNWLVQQVHKYSRAANWKKYGDVAVTFLVGPIIARRIIDPENRRLAYCAFIAYITFYLIALPLGRGGALFGGFNWIGVVVQLTATLLLGFAGYGIILLGTSAYAIIQQYVMGIPPAPGIGLAIPGTSFGGIHIPLVEGIIALIIALLVHEGAHGVVALQENVPVDEGGLLLLGMLPIGAYVEPDEKELKTKSTRSTARIMAAGPMANMVVFAVFAVILLALTPLSNYAANAQCQESTGVKILNVPKTLHVGGNIIPSGAYGHFPAGSVITEINGQRVQCIQEFFKILAPLKKEEYNGPITLGILEGNREKEVTITMHMGYMGVEGVENNYIRPLPMWLSAVLFIISLVYWIGLLNFMIGLVNMLPVPPLDGGQLFRTLAEREGMKTLYKVILWATIIVFVINGLPWIIK